MHHGLSFREHHSVMPSLSTHQASRCPTSKDYSVLPVLPMIPPCLGTLDASLTDMLLICSGINHVVELTTTNSISLELFSLFDALQSSSHIPEKPSSLLMPRKQGQDKEMKPRKSKKQTNSKKINKNILAPNFNIQIDYGNFNGSNSLKFHVLFTIHLHGHTFECWKNCMNKICILHRTSPHTQTVHIVVIIMRSIVAVSATFVSYNFD